MAFSFYYVLYLTPIHHLETLNHHPCTFLDPTGPSHDPPRGCGIGGFSESWRLV